MLFNLYQLNIRVKKRKGENSWQWDQRELAFAQRLDTPEQKEKKGCTTSVDRGQV